MIRDYIKEHSEEILNNGKFPSESELTRIDSSLRRFGLTVNSLPPSFVKDMFSLPSFLGKILCDDRNPLCMPIYDADGVRKGFQSFRVGTETPHGHAIKRPELSCTYQKGAQIEMHSEGYWQVNNSGMKTNDAVEHVYWYDNALDGLSKAWINGFNGWGEEKGLHIGLCGQSRSLSSLFQMFNDIQEMTPHAVHHLRFGTDLTGKSNCLNFFLAAASNTGLWAHCRSGYSSDSLVVVNDRTTQELHNYRVQGFSLSEFCKDFGFEMPAKDLSELKGKSLKVVVEPPQYGLHTPEHYLDILDDIVDTSEIDFVKGYGNNAYMSDDCVRYDVRPIDNEPKVRESEAEEEDEEVHYGRGR